MLLTMEVELRVKDVNFACFGIRYLMSKRSFKSNKALL
jgi:hypothetical protein